MRRAVVAAWAGAAVLMLGSDACWGADDRLAAFGMLGLGGVSVAEVDFETGLDPGADERELDTTLGLGVSYDVQLVRHFSLGGLFRAYAWGGELYAWESRGDNTGAGFDFAIQPRAHVDVDPVELYLTVPIGLTLATKEENRTFLLVDTEYDLGVGYNWGLFAGVQYPIAPVAAAFIEVGWLLHTVFQRGEAEADASLAGDLEYRTGQLTFNLGIAF